MTKFIVPQVQAQVQVGGGVCSLCESPGTNKSTCPLNSAATKQNPAKHPLAAASPLTLTQPLTSTTQPLTSTTQPSLTLTPVVPSPVVKATVKPKVKATVKATVKPKVKATVQAQAKVTTPVVQVQVQGQSQDTTQAQTPINLEEAYLTTTGRFKLKEQFLTFIKNKDVRQCLHNQLDKYISVGKRLGSGSFGIVYSATTPTQQRFAIKQGRTTMPSVKSPWSNKTDWTEALILRDIVTPLIKKRVCPNLPLMYETYVCTTCDFEDLEKKKTTTKPCLILMTELANGDLSNWLKTKPSIPELYNALFQILAGLYSIHKNGQVCNNDVKAQNILYYNVKVIPGSYWVYNIFNKKYYIPNIGKLFIVNDFGVSKTLSPEFPTFVSDSGSAYNRRYHLGIRSFTAIDKKIVPYVSDDVINSRIITFNNNSFRSVRTMYLDKTNKHPQFPIKVELTDRQKQVLTEAGLPTDPMNLKFYSNSDILPPMELIYDTLDALSMFIGDIPRASQPENHDDFGVPQAFKQALMPYIERAMIMQRLLLSKKNITKLGDQYVSDLTNLHPATVHAGYMIDELFGSASPKYNFKTPMAGAPIEEYTI